MSKKLEPNTSTVSSSSSSSTNHNQSSCNKSAENTTDHNLTNQENDLSKVSKRFSKSKLRNNSITNKFNDFLEGNCVSSSSKNTPTEPLIMNCETISDTTNHESAFSRPSCSHSDPARQGNIGGDVQKEENDKMKRQANHYLDSSRVSKGGDDSENANDDTNSDDLAHLELNKCNIADDSDDSESNKFVQSRFAVSKMNLDSSSNSLQNSKSVSNQPVNHNLTSPQSSNAINSSDLSNRELSKSQVNCTLSRSIRNSNTTPIRNPCQMHRASISSNDLMSSSNYHPSHRLLHSSYNSQSSHCCHNHFRHHHHHYEAPNHRIDSMIPISSFRQQQCLQANQKHPFEFGMSSIEATTIISNHCNTENTNAPNSAAITKLTSSSNSGFPVTALTVMESPNLSSSRNGSYNWQAFMSTLKDRMATIFNCELLADVHFNVGKGNTQTRFPAHKFILSIGSAVFDAMFNGPLAKANKQKYSDSDLHLNNSDIEIELPDIEPEAFQALLRFLYLDEVQIGPETVMTTLYAAKKYEVPALEMACVDFLKANLSPDNAFMLLTQARLFDEATLADLCLETIDKHTMDSLYSDSFFDIDLDTLKLVLSRDSLRVREVSLFLAALRWAECECNRRSFELSSENKRNVLDDALYLIRFPLMTIEEFAHNVAQSAVLTDKELVNLFLHFTVSSKPSVPFSIEPRCCITGEECSVNRFQRTESRWGYSGTSDRIRFLTDRPIFVIGFGLFGSIHGASEYEAVIEVIHTGSGKVLASNTTSFISDGSDSTFRVMFKYPVEISQNTNYTACATLKGVDSYYGTNGYRTVTVNLGKGDTKDAVTFQFSYAAGCNNGTSVEDGQIPEIIFYT